MTRAPVRPAARRGRALLVPLLAVTLAAIGPAGPAVARRVPAHRTTALAFCDAGWADLGAGPLRRFAGEDVALGSDGRTWIAGIRTSGGGSRRPAIRRRSGGRWSWDLPVVGSDAGLVAIDHGPGGTWAAGFRAIGRTLRPLVLAEAGGRWVDRSPLVPGSSTLTDIAVAGDGSAVAVGYRVGPGGPRPVVFTRGPAWLRSEPAPGTGRFGALTSVAIGAGGTWIAGWTGGRAGIRPYLARANGRRWLRVELPLPDGEAVITGLATGPGTAVHVTGYRMDGPRAVPFLADRRNGTWHVAPLPSTPDGLDVLPDAIDVGGDGLLVGGSARRGRLDYAPFVAEGDGATWRFTMRPATTSRIGQVRGVAIERSRAVAAGWGQGGRGIAVHTCQADARVLGPAAPAQLPAEHAPPDPPRPIRIERRGIVVRDIAAEVGIAATTHTYGAAAFDADGDGSTDLFISRHTARAPFYRNVAGRFERSWLAPAVDRHGCAAGDIDEDGMADLACAVGAAEGMKMGPNELVRDIGSETREDLAAGAGTQDVYGRGRRMVIFDADTDGHLDLLWTDDPVRVDGLPSVGRLMLGDGTGSFRPAPSLGLDLPTGGGCLATASFDGAASPDVLLCTDEAWAGSPAGLHILRRLGSAYRDVTADLALPGAAGVTDVAVADLDGDGHPDLATLSPTRFRVLLRRGPGRFVEVAGRHLRGGGVAIAAGDIDGDGDQDLYVVTGTQTNTRDLLLRNRGSGRSWEPLRISQGGRGSADDVVAIDHDGDGAVAFLVLNGARRRGPIQLIARTR